MIPFHPKHAALAAMLAVGAVPSQAALIVSEVAPWGSGNSSYAADWFEVTNTGVAAVDVRGWRMDDGSNNFATTVALRGVTSIAAGQSVIFLEGRADGATDAAIDAAFVSAWFGANAPAGLVIGNYGGSGVGLGTGGDGVNLFKADGTRVTGIRFPDSTSSVGRSFDNASGVENAGVAQLSTIGVNGAFLSFDGSATGSPGAIAAVPEPGTWAFLISGLVLLGAAVLRRA